MKLRYIYLVCIAFGLSFINTTYGQNRYHKRSFEIIGLPGLEDIGFSLLVGIPLLIIGFLVLTSGSKGKSGENSNSNFGCIGVLIMGIGILFLLPLFALIEFVFVSILSVIIIIAIIGVIINYIFKTNN